MSLYYCMYVARCVDVVVVVICRLTVVVALADAVLLCCTVKSAYNEHPCAGPVYVFVRFIRIFGVNSTKRGPVVRVWFCTFFIHKHLLG